MKLLKNKFLVLIPILSIMSLVSCSSVPKENLKDELLNLYPNIIETKRKDVTLEKVRQEYIDSLPKGKYNSWKIFGIENIPQKYNLNLLIRNINWWDPYTNSLKALIEFVKYDGLYLLVNGKHISKQITIVGFKE